MGIYDINKYGGGGGAKTASFVLSAGILIKGLFTLHLKATLGTYTGEI